MAKIKRANISYAKISRSTVTSFACYFHKLVFADSLMLEDSKVKKKQTTCLYFPAEAQFSRAMIINFSKISLLRFYRKGEPCLGSQVGLYVWSAQEEACLQCSSSLPLQWGTPKIRPTSGTLSKSQVLTRQTDRQTEGWIDMSLHI